MKKQRFTEHQIIGVLKNRRLARTRDSEAKFYNWKAKYGGMEVSEAKRLKAVMGLSEWHACQIVSADGTMVHYQSNRPAESELAEDAA